MTYSSTPTPKKNTNTMSEKFSDASNNIISTPAPISVSSTSQPSNI